MAQIAALIAAFLPENDRARPEIRGFGWLCSEARWYTWFIHLCL